MKENKKMSFNRTVKVKKMSARVPNLVYIKAKCIAESQGMTMEEKITELLKKEIQIVSSQKWFQEYIQEQDEGSQGFELFDKKIVKSKASHGSQEAPSSYDQFDDWDGSKT